MLKLLFHHNMTKLVFEIFMIHSYWYIIYLKHWHYWCAFKYSKKLETIVDSNTSPHTITQLKLHFIYFITERELKTSTIQAANFDFKTMCGLTPILTFANRFRYWTRICINSNLRKRAKGYHAFGWEHGWRKLLAQCASKPWKG